MHLMFYLIASKTQPEPHNKNFKSLWMFSRGIHNSSASSLSKSAAMLQEVDGQNTYVHSTFSART